MKLIGIMPVRNEAWVLGLSARVALKWCDELLILLHASTDDSERIVHEVYRDYPGRVTIAARETDTTWNEMEHRQRLLTIAREQGATHIAIIDADEVLTGNLLPNIHRFGGICDNIPAGAILQLPGYNLRDQFNPETGFHTGIKFHHDNGIWGKRWFSVAFADDPRLSWSGDKFHSREPQGAVLQPYRPVAQGQGGVMHLWGASERRLRAKSALYKITERLRWPQKPIEDIDLMYSWAIHGSPENKFNYGTPETWTYSAVPAEWWAGYEHLMKYLDVDAEPWQEAECIRLVKEHGPQVFKELDLFGVV